MNITASLVNELRSMSGAGMMDCKKALVATEGNLDKAMDYLRENGIAKATKKAERIAAEGLANVYIEGNKAVIIEVNSETDFVSKNEEFKTMIDEIGSALLKSDAKTVEEANELKVSDGSSVAELIVAKTAKMGEKLSLRRFTILNKNDDEVFSSYLHMGGKIAVVAQIKGGSENIAHDLAMQAAAMRPEYIYETEIPADVIEREKSVAKEQAINEGKPQERIDGIVEGRVKKFYKEVCLYLQAFFKDPSVDIKTYLSNNHAELINVVRYEVGEGMEKRNDDFASEVMNQIKG